MEPILLAKYKDGTYQKGSFSGRSNTDHNLITCEDKIFILSILQSYVINLYHTHILHPGTDISEAMICQHLHCP